MKKTRKAVSMILSLILCLTVGCGTGESEKSAEKQGKEGLTLYVDAQSELLIQYAMGDIEKTAIEPIHWNLVDLRNLTPEEFQKKLYKDLEAGKGPDVIFINPDTCPDPYLAMQKGYFMDLTEAIEQFEGHEDTIVPDLLEEGSYQGVPYLLTAGYVLPIYLGKETVLESTGFELEKSSTLPEFFEQANESKETDYFFDQKGELEKAIRQYAGSWLIDYENKTVGLDEEWEKLCRLYQKLYEMDQSTPEYEREFFSGFRRLNDGNALLTASIEENLNYFVADIRAVDYKDTPVLVPLQTQKGTIAGEITSSFGINVNTKKKEEAYQFVHELLHIIRPSVIYGQQEGNRWTQVYTFVIAQITLDECFEMVAQGGVPLAPFNVDDPEAYDYYNRYLELLYWPMEASFETVVTKDGGIIEECMEPFFAGEESYESCAETLKTKLEEYLTMSQKEGKGA
ncbi:MAG: ABC transporter substrate-binding protein [Massiliimalia sp.]|jgi:ABC-type glycerol-3-phosphate transport system substrate-binding protein